MPAQAPSPVRLTTAGPCVGGTLAWRWKGKLHLTVAVKATFALVPGGPMTTAAPEELFRAEAHHRDNPARSVRATSDLVPYLVRADVVFTGHAHAPPGERVAMLPVRLAVFHKHPLFDKTLHVHGERKGAEVQPFDKMPMTYERALGGIGTPNPLGSASPSIVHPTDASAVAGFAPISRALPQRKKLLGALQPRQLDEAIPELPTDFDWTYYQSAPPDQRVDSLQGNEWIVLEGLHPELPRLSSRLPGARGLARIYGLDPDHPDAPRPAVLRPDILRIDGDAGRCSLVLRVVLPLEDESALARLRIVAGVETEAQGIPWPEAPPPIQAAFAATGAIAAQDDDYTETLALADSDAQSGPHVGTVALDEVPSHANTLPFVPASRPSAIPPAPRPADEHPFAGTYALDTEAAVQVQRKPAMPFAERPSSSGGAPPSSRSIPGAPWSNRASAPPPPPPDPDTETTRTMQFDFSPEMQGALDDKAPAAEPPPPPPSRAAKPAPAPEPPPPPTPAPPSAETAPERPAKPTWSWATPPEEPKVEPPKAPKAPPRPPPKPAVNKSLYGGFTPKKK